MDEEINKPTDQKSIYDLKMHEIWNQDMCWGIRYEITRVPGGWIYQAINREFNGKDEYYQPVYIPYNNEFQTS